MDGSAWRGRLEPLRTIGRVPFFFYVTHFIVLRLTALVVPKLSLAGAYGIWLALLGVMLGPCAWYFRVKTERPNVVTRYL